MSNSEAIGFLWAAFVVALIAAGAYGWVMNIVYLFHADAFSGLVLMRAVGIMFAPLGAILGYV